MGFFTVGNLKPMLKNRFYIGVKTYRQKGETKEAEAVWPPIIDRETFDKANALLAKNYRRNKDRMSDRFPFQLVGLVSCKTCGDRMVGKSAHGRVGKVPYYEHAWATIKGSTVPGLKHECAPYRVLAKQLEPALWQEVVKILKHESIARGLLDLAQKNHLLNRDSKEVEKCNQTIFSVDRQLEVLAERLATLPESISPTPVYKQMEKLEGHKKDAMEKLAKLRESGVIRDEPAELKDFEKFLGALREILDLDDSVESRIRIIRAIVKKVLITPEGFDVFFKVGDSQVKVFLSDLQERSAIGSEAKGANFGQKNRAVDLSDPSPLVNQKPPKNLGVFGSNTCVSGRGDWI